jgi:hypothetical protein
MTEASERPPFDQLLARAMQRVPGGEATETLWNLRNERTDKYGRSLAYEIVVKLDPPDAWRKFIDVELPKLGVFLISKKFGPTGGPQVLVALWVAEHMYLFEAQALFEAVGELDGVTVEELARRIRASAQPTHEGSLLGHMPLAIPDPKKDN